MGVGLRVLKKATKNKAPIPNVKLVMTGFILAPMHFPFDPTAGKIHDLYFQLVAARPKVFLPQLINFIRRTVERLFPAGLLLLDGASPIRAQLVGKAKDLNLGQPTLCCALDDRDWARDCLLLGNA